MPDRPEVDATRRTRLAGERTYLAWLRGGLASLAVGIGAGAVVPDLTEGRHWTYVSLGAGFIVMGIALMAYGLHRHRAVERALDRGDYAPFDPRAAAVLAALGVALGVLTLVAVLAGA